MSILNKYSATILHFKLVAWSGVYFWKTLKKNMLYKDNFSSICWYKHKFIKKSSVLQMSFVVLCNSILNPGPWILHFLDKYQIYGSASFEQASAAQPDFCFLMWVFAFLYQKISKSYFCLKYRKATLRGSASNFPLM